MHCPHCGNRISDSVAATLKTCPACKHELGAAGAPTGRAPEVPSLAPDEITQDIKTAGARRPDGLTNKFEPGARIDQVKTPARSAHSAPRVAVADMIPKKLGHFEIRGKLGEGGMGMVLDGYDPQLDRRVAIKVLSPRLAEDEQFVKRFLSEARAIAKVSHPNVAAVHFADSDAGRHFFVMEFIDGESLDDIVEKKGRLSPKAAIGYIMQAVRGLSAAAERGIVHRDVKPANLMVSRQGEVKVMDFGLAKRADENLKLTQAGSVLGSPHFMAPEQSRGEQTDLRADIYSLGATLYFLLTGKPPYDGDTAVAIILKHQEAPVPQIERAPPSLNRLLGKMMAKNPAERYQTYDELMKDLVRLDRSGLLRDELLPTTGVVPVSAQAAVPAGKRPSDIPTQKADDEAVLLSKLEAAMKNAPDRVKTPVVSRSTTGVARKADTTLTKLLGRAAEAAPQQLPAEASEEQRPLRIGRVLLVLGAVAVVGVLLLRPWNWADKTSESSSPSEAQELLAGIERLRPLLNDPAPETRRHALVTLARRYAGPTAESLILQAQKDEDPSVRLEAVKMLAVMRRSGAVEAIFRSLKDESPEVRAGAASTLEELTGYSFLSRIDWRTADPGLRKEIADEFMEWWRSSRGSR